MAPRRTSSDSGRNYARGVAPARTPTASLAGTPDSPLRSADSLASARSLRGTALRLLSRRDYTSSELRKKLLERDHDADAVDTLIQDLTASRLLDDRRVAASHVRTAAAIKGRGRLRIARELAARGLPKDIVSEALGAVEKQDEAAAIRKILTRKKWPATPSLAERRRMFQHLLGRGYPSDAIGRALGGQVTTGDDE